jgi:hypothetical protein
MSTRRRSLQPSERRSVSADLKGSQFSRFRGEPESLPVVAEHTNTTAAVEDKAVGLALRGELTTLMDYKLACNAYT